LFNYFYLALNQRQQLNNSTMTTMQWYDNNLAMQYACGTNQRVRA